MNWDDRCDNASQVVKRGRLGLIGYYLLACLVLILSANNSTQAQSEEGIESTLVAAIDQHWASSRYKTRVEQTQGFLLPLGAMKKVRGVWRPAQFQAIDGTLKRTTWQISGESVATLFTSFAEQISGQAKQQWHCQGRTCGNGAEWANRVYQERLLYGRDEYMNYSAYQTDDGIWITLFSAARTADRQYLHLDVIYPGSGP